MEIRTNTKHMSSEMQITSKQIQILPHFSHLLLRHRRRRMCSSSSDTTEASKKKSKEPRGRSKSKKRTASKYELLDRSKTKKSSRSNSLADMSTSAKKKSMERMTMTGKFLMQLLVVALFLVLPLTLLLCLATDSVQSDNTWLAFVVHLYTNATCVLITLAAFLFKGLLLLPLYLAVFTINFLLWLFNCNEPVVEQILTTATTGPDLQVKI